MPAREDTINVQLGEVLQELRPASWRVLAEHQRTLRNTSARPDILIEEPAGWPVVIEAERENHASAEQDALARLGAVVDETGHPIESAIALVYPPDVREQTGGRRIRAALRATEALEYALYSAASGDAVERLPESGWLRGNVRDLAMLAQRAAIPAQRVERLVDALEQGVSAAAGEFNRRHRSHGVGIGGAVAEVLGQSDDQAGQTRLMAMTVLINALIFHESLAQAGLALDDERTVALVQQFNSTASGFDQQAIITEWRAILEVNYWPIFATAGEILQRLPIATANAVLQPLWEAARQLIRGGVTKSHDLTGVIFQRLIADRKFLATYYTRPAAAALLAGLALHPRGASDGAGWGDAEAVAGLQIGDFACGTGTLLAAAYQRVSLLHELHGGDPQALHAPMMRDGLVGLDVLNIAVHLTATMLAGSHPDTPFDGDCLLTMPYGTQNGDSVAIGSLDLLAAETQGNLINAAVAMTAGGHAPKEVPDLVSRLGHGKFDLVIMNPPFTRYTGNEGFKIGAGNPAFGAFETTGDDRDRMRRALQRSRGAGALGGGNAGLAADFLDLALRKLTADGALALVLPLSALSGVDWQAARAALRSRFDELTVVTVAGAKSDDSSFSADTGMADCLIVAARSGAQADRPRAERARFIVLDARPGSAQEGALLAAEILRAGANGSVARLEDPTSSTTLRLGGAAYGSIVDAPLPDEGGWPIAGVADLQLAAAAHNLAGTGAFPLLFHGDVDVRIPVAPLGAIAERGPYHMDIKGKNSDGTARGPFSITRPPRVPVPTYPVLWRHDAKRERTLQIEPDAQGEVINGATAEERAAILRKTPEVWASATRAHYNRDLQFNSQSLIAAMTERKCIGGHGWPSVIFADTAHEYAFALWCNSSLGLLLHWWSTNKTQSGRGRTTVTAIPNIPTLDTRALSDEQHAAAREAFEAMRELRFLPFDQIDEDPARAELDRRLLVNVLGLPASLCEPDGPIDLLRRKLAREPQIHGGKKSRVVFTEDGGEKSQRRRDRD